MCARTYRTYILDTHTGNEYFYFILTPLCDGRSEIDHPQKIRSAVYARNIIHHAHTERTSTYLHKQTELSTTSTINCWILLHDLDVDGTFSKNTQLACASAAAVQT